MNDKELLVLSDMAGVGKVALGVMIPVLSALKVKTTCLPTALVSNNFAYPKYEILDTTDYVVNTLKTWTSLGFKFDAIATGFIATLDEAKAIYEYVLEAKKRGCKVLVDPIMADDGSLYPGIGIEIVDSFKLMAKLSDVIVPNMTEATILTNTFVGKTELNKEELDTLVNKMHELTNENVIITSVKVNGKNCTVLKPAGTKEYEMIEFEHINMSFPGTGDIFSSVVIGNYMNGVSIHDCTVKAMHVVESLIKQHINIKDINRGIPVELHLKEIINA